MTNKPNAVVPIPMERTITKKGVKRRGGSDGPAVEMPCCEGEKMFKFARR